jgi:hypothetical protein
MSLVEKDSSMSRLWLVFGLIYLLIAALIFLHHSLSLNAVWQWEEALHHEAFFIATVWVSSAYLFVAFVEYLKKRKKTSTK